METDSPADERQKKADDGGFFGWWHGLFASDTAKQHPDSKADAGADSEGGDASGDSSGGDAGGGDGGGGGGD